MDDAELVARSQRGDRGAFEELVRRTSRLVYARIYLETGDRQRTEDLVQEAFLSAWKNIRQVSDPNGVRSWLYAIAHSVVVDAARREGRLKRSRPRVEGLDLNATPGREPPPEQRAEQGEDRERLLSVLRSLPEDYRTVLAMRYLMGADYESIGQQLGLSNGSLRGLLNRGMALLRQQFVRREPREVGTAAHEPTHGMERGLASAESESKP